MEALKTTINVKSKLIPQKQTKHKYIIILLPQIKKHMQNKP
jgi:hypothetical protein